MLKRVRRFSILLVLLGCFLCLHVQEWQGRTSPNDTTVCIICFFVVPYISYMARMVMRRREGELAE